MKKEINKNEKMAFYFCAFEVFRKANIVSLVKKYFEGSVARRSILIVFPIIVFSINVLLIIKSDAFLNTKLVMSYATDLSNSLGLSVLYFISYFLSYYFPMQFDKWIKTGIKEDRRNQLEVSIRKKKNVIEILNKKRIILTAKRRTAIIVIVGLTLFIIGFLSGYFFYAVAKENGDLIWISNMGFLARTYYCFFLGLTWYHSLSVLGMALTAGFIIFWTIRSSAIEYQSLDYNHNLSIINAVDVLLCTFSYGLFYIVGSVLFIFNDKLAASMEEPYKIENTFANDTAALILIVSVLILVIVAYIPLQEVLNFMKRQKIKLILEYNQKIEETVDKEEKDLLIERRNYVMEQPLILTSASNKIMLVLSVGVPLVGVILQGIELFN